MHLILVIKEIHRNPWVGGGYPPPLLEILVIKGFFGIIRVIKHCGNFAEGEKFWRKILLGRGGYPPPLLEILVIKGEYSKIAVIKDLWGIHGYGLISGDPIKKY